MKSVLEGSALVATAATLLLAAGCATTVRLNANFDADPVGAPPATSPPPTPPNDVLSWTVSQQVTSTVVANPAGGRWLRITPNPAFLSDPDSRKRALIAATEALTTSPPANVRGHLRLNLMGTGTVYLGLQLTQGAQRSDFIGGIAVGSYPVPNPPLGQAYLLGEFTLARIETDIYGLPSRGKLADYAPGTLVSIHWSIDQASRTFSASVNGGTAQSGTFAAVSGGVTTTPMQQLSLYVWLEKPTSSTAVFIDDLHVEEFR